MKTLTDSFTSITKQKAWNEPIVLEARKASALYSFVIPVGV